MTMPPDDHQVYSNEMPRGKGIAYGIEPVAFDGDCELMD